MLLIPGAHFGDLELILGLLNKLVVKSSLLGPLARHGLDHQTQKV